MTRILNDIQNGTDVVYNYEYDDAGNAVSMEESLAAWPPSSPMRHEYEYGYNGGYRLMTASHPEELLGTLADEGYSYDGVGNRLSALADNLGHPGEVDYEYGNPNILTADALYDYEYDGDGRLTKRTEKSTGWYRSLVWDARDRLLSVEEYDDSGTMQSYYRYYYDGLGRRIARQVNGTMYRYVYDGANVAYEFTNGPREGTREPSLGMGLMLGPDNPYGFWTARYTWAGTDFMLNMLRSEAIGWLTTVRNNRGGTLDDCSSDLPESIDWCDYEPLHVGNYFPVLDRLNTVRGYYDMTQREGFSNNTPMVAMYEYDSFGRPTHEEGLLHSPYRFTGREYDPETGYYFYRSRYYDPSLGRFLTQDPVFHNDLYSYVGNNPVNSLDPFGRDMLDYLTGEQSFEDMWNEYTAEASAKNTAETGSQGFVQGAAEEGEESSTTPGTSTPSGGSEQASKGSPQGQTATERGQAAAQAQAGANPSASINADKEWNDYFNSLPSVRYKSEYMSLCKDIANFIAQQYVDQLSVINDINLALYYDKVRYGDVFTYTNEHSSNDIASSLGYYNTSVDTAYIDESLLNPNLSVSYASLIFVFQHEVYAHRYVQRNTSCSVFNKCENEARALSKAFYNNLVNSMYPNSYVTFYHNGEKIIMTNNDINFAFHYRYGAGKIDQYP